MGVFTEIRRLYHKLSIEEKMEQYRVWYGTTPVRLTIVDNRMICECGITGGGFSFCIKLQNFATHKYYSDVSTNNTTLLPILPIQMKYASLNLNGDILMSYLFRIMYI